MTSQEQINITKSLKKLKEILQWFKSQEELDVEQGLKKLKQAAPLIKDLKSRLSGIENQFEQIKQEFTDNSSS